jgi:hypothetical protein
MKKTRRVTLRTVGNETFTLTQSTQRERAGVLLFRGELRFEVEIEIAFESFIEQREFEIEEVEGADIGRIGEKGKAYFLDRTGIRMRVNRIDAENAAL